MVTIRAFVMLVLSAALLAGGLAGCSKSDSNSPSRRPGGLKVLCSTYPMYLFTRQVTAGCEGVEVEMMLPAGVGCPHDYILTPGDMQKLAAADVLVLNGLGMDNFTLAPLRRANPTLIVIDTAPDAGQLLALFPKGDETAHDDEEDDEGDGCDHCHDHRHEAGEFNPHPFASPRMAALVVNNIAAGLGKADPANAKRYTKNGQAYAKKLNALADEMVAALADVPNRRIVTEHAVFDYLARDCGLKIAAVIEETPGQDPVVAKMRALIDQIRASGATVIFTEPRHPLDGPQRPGKVAQTLADELGLPVEVLDPIAIGPDNPRPDDYETRMRANLATLVRVLK